MNRETTLLIKARCRVNIFQEVLFGLGGTRCPPARRSNAKAAQRVGKIMRAPPPDILAPSAIQVPSVRAGLAFFGEADPPLSLKRNSRVSEVTACVTRLEAGHPV